MHFNYKKLPKIYNVLFLFIFHNLCLQVKIRERLFAIKSNLVEEISPINVKDINRIDNKLEGPDKKKRKLDNDLVKLEVKNNYLNNFKDKLNDEQKEVVNAINTKNNIFFTGK